MGEGWIRHGGDLNDARHLAGDEAGVCGTDVGGWMDLSTGVNPHAYPVPLIPDGAWKNLPGRMEYEALKGAARNFYGIPEDADIVMAPGTEMLLHVLPTVFARRRVEIVGPTYGSHRRAWEMHGHLVEEVGSLEEVDPSSLVVLVNPNNPDGRVVSDAVLSDFVKEVRNAAGFLVVDGAYGEVMEGSGGIGLCAGGRMIVLRSFGKFFGLPGVRLGFGIATQSLVEVLSARLGDWPVSGPAAYIGSVALSDRAWHQDMRARLSGLRRRMERVLTSHGVRVAGGTDLFLLVEVADSYGLFVHLLRHRVYVRHFMRKGGWLRIGTAGDEEVLSRLESGLVSWKMKSEGF